MLFCLCFFLDLFFKQVYTLWKAEKKTQKNYKRSNKHIIVSEIFRLSREKSIKSMCYLHQSVPYSQEPASVVQLDAPSELRPGGRGFKKGKRKVQGVPQSQTAALPWHQEEEETDKSKQAQTEQTYEKH